MFAPKNILVPTDFSEYSDIAFQKALDIAEKYDANIFLLHVINGVVQKKVTEFGQYSNFTEKILNESIVLSKENMQKLIEKYPQAKKVKVISKVKKGFPCDEILKDLRERKIDLVVIALDSRSCLMKPLTGSVTEKIVRGAGCPILLIKN